MAKTKETSFEYIVRLMEQAGTYDPRYELQIERAASTRDKILRIEKQMGKDMFDIQASYGGKSVGIEAKPHVAVLLQLEKLFQGQLSDLGLNYGGYKKPTNKKAESESMDDNDPTAEYFNSING